MSHFYVQVGLLYYIQRALSPRLCLPDGLDVSACAPICCFCCVTKLPLWRSLDVCMSVCVCVCAWSRAPLPLLFRKHLTLPANTPPALTQYVQGTHLLQSSAVCSTHTDTSRSSPRGPPSKTEFHGFPLYQTESPLLLHTHTVDVTRPSSAGGGGVCNEAAKGRKSKERKKGRLSPT